MLDRNMRAVDTPEPGFFAMRLVRHGPLVPCRIFAPCPMDPYTGAGMERRRAWPDTLQADAAGRRRNPLTVWAYGKRITHAEWLALAEKIKGVDVEQPITARDMAAPF
jgi:hypothetical protein